MERFNENFYAISVERKLNHPAVAAIVEGAHHKQSDSPAVLR